MPRARLGAPGLTRPLHTAAGLATLHARRRGTWDHDSERVTFDFASDVDVRGLNMLISERLLECGVDVVTWTSGTNGPR